MLTSLKSIKILIIFSELLLIYPKSIEYSLKNIVNNYNCQNLIILMLFKLTTDLKCNPSLELKAWSLILTKKDLYQHNKELTILFEYFT